MRKTIYESFSDVSDYIYLEHDVNDKTWISRAHYHNSIEFSVCLRGTHRICVNGSWFSISAGEILCVNSFEVHYFDIREGTEVIAVLIGEEYLEALKRLSLQSTIRFPTRMCNRARNKRAIEFLQQWNADKSNCTHLLHYGYSNLFLGELFRQYGLAGEPLPDKTGHVMIEALRYIQKNLKDRLTVEDMANRVGYSKNHFAKIFHEMVGQTFKDYINMQRAELAKEMIETESDRTIVDISFACGFESMATFYRAYEKRYGAPPRHGGGYFLMIIVRIRAMR